MEVHWLGLGHHLVQDLDLLVDPVGADLVVGTRLEHLLEETGRLEETHPEEERVGHLAMEGQHH